MDRFSWSDGILSPEEQLIVQQNGIRLYDGQHKTAFDQGKLMLTSHRMLWKNNKDQKCILSLLLSYLVLIEEESAGFASSAKVLLHVRAVTDTQKPPGPVASSVNSLLKLSFREGGEKQFFRYLTEALAAKRWEQTPQLVASTQPGQRAIRTGIGGIEKSIQQKHRETDQNISEAFEDLTKLMDKAKEMVSISKSISTKIKEKQGDITEDETVAFKSHLLSLGIDDPVTRDTHGSGHKYYRELAKQISDVMEQPLKECGGMMTLTDVYCRINRARGMELLSPDDLVNACQQMESLQLPVRLRVFESGVLVLQLQSHSEDAVVRHTATIAEEKGSITADELAKVISLSVVLAKERLLTAERAGKLCRDESTEGLRFYPNLLLTSPS